MYSYTKLELCQYTYGVDLILKKELVENIYQHNNYTKTTHKLHPAIHTGIPYNCTLVMWLGRL